MDTTWWLEALGQMGIDVAAFPTERKQRLMIMICQTYLGALESIPDNTLLPLIVASWDEALEQVSTEMLEQAGKQYRRILLDGHRPTSSDVWAGWLSLQAQAGE